jgi:ATP synthase protein I
MSEPADHPGRGNLSPEERAAFERRVKELDGKLDRVRDAKAAESSAGQQTRMSGRGMAYGLRMASELVAAVLVGGIIGYFLDYLLGTAPWLFLVMFLLGFVAGILNVLRAYRRLQSEIDAETGGNLGRRVADDDDD